MDKIFIVLTTLFFAFALNAQKTEKKSVNINVEVTDNGKRDVKVTATTNGEEKVYQWQDDGIVPEDMAKKLKADNIDVSELRDEHYDDHMISITVDGHVRPNKEYIIVKSIENDGDGESELLEWNGEGEMPTEMKVLIEKHGIDVESLGHGDKRMKKHMAHSKENRKKMRLYAMNKGKSLNKRTEDHFITIDIDDDGNKKVRSYSGDELSPEIEENISEERIVKIRVSDLEDYPSVIKTESPDARRLSDAYMGAHISSENEGATITEIEKDSPSYKANLQVGDVIHRLNGARVKNMEDLLDLLIYYEAEDKIELIITRDGQEKTIQLILGKRPKRFRL